MLPATSRLSAARIKGARSVIDPVFLNTPQYVHEPLSDELGVRTLVKVEVLNPVRCFKGRGADFHTASVPAGSHIVTASAGNLGQAFAWSCRSRGCSLTVYASVNANPFKLARMRELGAKVVLAGDDFDAAKAEAKRAAATLGTDMVEDGREPRLSEGAGTIGLELLEARERPDVVLVALGNGAILGGVARAIKAHAPNVEVIGVAAAGAPCMARSWRAGELVETATVDTVADGMATRVPIPDALADMRADVDDVVLVDDASMLAAVRTVHRHLGLVVEPSGGAGIAAIAADPERFAGRRVATVLCGGNLTDEQVSRWLG